jgi:acyl carrier protein
MSTDPANSAFGNFCRYLAVRLERDIPTEPQARLIEDVGLDSIGVYEAVVLVEELAGCIVENVDGIETLGDLWDLSETLAGRRT